MTTPGSWPSGWAGCRSREDRRVLLRRGRRDPSPLRRPRHDLDLPAYQHALEHGGATAVFVSPDGQIERRASPRPDRPHLGTDPRPARHQANPPRPPLTLAAGQPGRAPIPYQLLLRPAALATCPLFDRLTGLQLGRPCRPSKLRPHRPARQRRFSYGSGTRLHPLVRDTSHPVDESQRLALLTLAARLLQQAAYQGTGLPEDPPAWAWHAAPHATHLLHSLTALPDLPDGIGAVAHALQWRPALRQPKGFASRPKLSTGTCSPPGVGIGARPPGHAVHPARHRRGEWRCGVIMPGPRRNTGTCSPPGCGCWSDHPDTLVTRNEIAQEMTERGNHAGAETEFRDVLPPGCGCWVETTETRWSPGITSPG